VDQEKIKIEDLVNEFYDQLNQRNYGQSVKWAYHKVCRQILEWCNKHHFVSFDEKTGNQFCDETIGGHLSKAGSPYHYRRTLRVMRMLVSLQHTGDFEFRSPRTEYKFYTQLGDVIDMYLHYCAVMRKFSATTLSERKRAIFRFDNYLNGNNRTIADITVDLFEDFLTQHCTKHSRRNYKSIFKELYRYLFDNGILNKDYSSLILKEPKVAQASKLPITYTEEEIRRMINAIDRGSAKGKRDYLVLLLGAEYGWRASDITSLSNYQIDWNKNKISIIQFKTGIPVEFPLLASVGNAIIDYLKYGRPVGGDNVIIVNHENTHKGKKLTSPTIHSIIANAMKVANINNWKNKKHGPHALRHSLASNMLKHNVSIPIIKTVLGHQSVETTKVYVSVDIERLRLCSLPIPKITSQYYDHKTKL
jgi:site-specific recombinase XerD